MLFNHNSLVQPNAEKKNEKISKNHFFSTKKTKICEEKRKFAEEKREKNAILLVLPIGEISF